MPRKPHEPQQEALHGPGTPLEPQGGEGAILPFRAPGRPRWEYRVEWLRLDYRAPDAALEEALRGLGALGWELVSFREDVRQMRPSGPTGDVAHFKGLQAILKRPLG